MIARLILVCVTLLFVCRTYVGFADLLESPECKLVKTSVYSCAAKYKTANFTPTLPEEFFRRASSKVFIEPTTKCIEASVPVNETVLGCTSNIAMTIAAHCIRAEMFNMVPLKWKHAVLVFLDYLVMCMAEELQQPLALLRSAVESTR
ncbi:uncharacterized protein LOC125945610 [Dermacentor silvarum]|uniref:uncharacterized protein LOC125945610 n=1 Tax=Dermacentor silvarum TaxID=543639 RepID=UPI0021008B05|nr:uncharacterized protein LOC125945610 [Dermacentor silvarum]